MLSILFNKVFNNYTNFYANPSVQREENIKKIIKYDIPHKLSSYLNLDPNKYLVKGSYGVGNPTETPWIAIFDKRITTSAQHGFYIVFLFRKDMKGVYLSLNQGTTYLRAKFKGFKPVQKMREVAIEIKKDTYLFPISGSVNEIDLASEQQNAKAYEAANIYARYYESSSFPGDHILLSDLNLMMKNLNEISRYVGIRSLDQVIDELIYREELNDAKLQEDILISIPTQTPVEPRLIPEKKRGTAIREQFNRDSKIAKEALEIANYQCEVNPSHITFISPLTKQNFVEAHHLVPISNQEKFKYSLDVPGNIISLCPNCHREIHHGTSYSKKILIRTLYQKRKDMLTRFGIDVKLDKILKMYNI